MPEYGFSLARILPYKNRIYDSVFKRQVHKMVEHTQTESIKFLGPKIWELITDEMKELESL